MPVGTTAAVKALTSEDLVEIGAEIILGNLAEGFFNGVAIALTECLGRLVHLGSECRDGAAAAAIIPVSCAQVGLCQVPEPLGPWLIAVGEPWRLVGIDSVLKRSLSEGFLAVEVSVERPVRQPRVFHHGTNAGAAKSFIAQPSCRGVENLPATGCFQFRTFAHQLLMTSSGGIPNADR